MATNRRTQTPKPRNEAWMRAEQERQRSSVAQPHRNKSKYDRRDKHRNKRGW